MADYAATVMWDESGVTVLSHSVIGWSDIAAFEAPEPWPVLVLHRHAGVAGEPVRILPVRPGRGDDELGLRDFFRPLAKQEGFIAHLHRFIEELRRRQIPSRGGWIDGSDLAWETVPALPPSAGALAVHQGAKLGGLVGRTLLLIGAGIAAGCVVGVLASLIAGGAFELIVPVCVVVGAIALPLRFRNSPYRVVQPTVVLTAEHIYAKAFGRAPVRLPVSALRLAVEGTGSVTFVLGQRAQLELSDGAPDSVAAHLRQRLLRPEAAPPESLPA